jgi:DNA-binding NarL/FixJ family response regulator
VLERKLRRAAAKVRRIMRISQEPMSLEMPVGQEESSLLGDFIEDETIPGPVDAASKQLLREQVGDILKYLTEREREVLDLIAAGRTNGQIAAELFLAPKTVRNNVSAILSKLQATDRAEVIIRARDAGMGQRD